MYLIIVNGYTVAKQELTAEEIKKLNTADGVTVKKA